MCNHDWESGGAVVMWVRSPGGGGAVRVASSTGTHTEDAATRVVITGARRTRTTRHNITSTQRCQTHRRFAAARIAKTWI